MLHSYKSNISPKSPLVSNSTDSLVEIIAETQQSSIPNFIVHTNGLEELPVSSDGGNMGIITLSLSLGLAGLLLFLYRYGSGSSNMVIVFTEFLTEALGRDINGTMYRVGERFVFDLNNMFPLFLFALDMRAIRAMYNDASAHIAFRHVNGVLRLGLVVRDHLAAERLPVILSELVYRWLSIRYSILTHHIVRYTLQGVIPVTEITPPPAPGKVAVHIYPDKNTMNAMRERTSFDAAMKIDRSLNKPYRGQ